MQLMDGDLMRLVKEGKISAGDAYVKAVSKKEFEPFVEEEEKAAAQKRVPNFKAVAVPPAANQPATSAPRPAVPQPQARPAAAAGATTRKA
jgi:hypothetical protein